MSAHLWAALFSGLTAVWAWSEAFEMDVEHGPDGFGFGFSLGVCWEVAAVALVASASCAISLWNA